MTVVSLVLNSAVMLFGTFILVAGGGLLVVRRGRLYALFLMAGVLLLLAGMARNVHMALLIYAHGATPGGVNLTSTWVSMPISLIGSTAVALTWVLVLIPMMRPDTLRDDDSDGPLAEGGA